MTDDRSLPIDHEPLNRAERRAQRFRPHAGQADPHAVPAAPTPTDEAGAQELVADEADDEALTANGSGGATRLAGAGTGGATESADRVPHHEGMHLGNQPNS